MKIEIIALPPGGAYTTVIVVQTDIGNFAHPYTKVDDDLMAFLREKTTKNFADRFQGIEDTFFISGAAMMSLTYGGQHT